MSHNERSPIQGRNALESLKMSTRDLVVQAMQSVAPPRQMVAFQALKEQARQVVAAGLASVAELSNNLAAESEVAHVARPRGPR